MFPRRISLSGSELLSPEGALTDELIGTVGSILYGSSDLKMMGIPVSGKNGKNLKRKNGKNI